MFSLKYSKRFKKELKIFKNNEEVLLALEIFLDILNTGKSLASKYRNHALKGEFQGCFECHIKPDVLLIYKKDKQEISILLLRIGSHSDLF